MFRTNSWYQRVLLTPWTCDEEEAKMLGLLPRSDLYKECTCPSQDWNNRPTAIWEDVLKCPHLDRDCLCIWMRNLFPKQLREGIDWLEDKIIDPDVPYSQRLEDLWRLAGYLLSKWERSNSILEKDWPPREEIERGNQENFGQREEVRDLNLTMEEVD